MDVEGWRGDNFPFTFNIADYNVVASESVHLPPAAGAASDGDRQPVRGRS